MTRHLVKAADAQADEMAACSALIARVELVRSSAGSGETAIETAREAAHAALDAQLDAVVAGRQHTLAAMRDRWKG